MKRFAILLSCVALASCSPPVMFSVDVDEPIVVGTLTLNGQSAKLMKNLDGAYWGKWTGSDADGRIDILYSDGERASCTIGYVTHGMGVQRFVVSDRRCQPVEGD